MAQLSPTWTPVVNLPANCQHFPEPVVTAAHGKPEGVAGLPNRLALIEHEATELRLLRLRWMVDATRKLRSMTKLRWQSGFVQRHPLVPALFRPRLCVLPPQKIHDGLDTAAPTRFLAKRRSNSAFSRCSRHSSGSRAQTNRVPCASGAVTGNFRAPLYRRFRQWTNDVAISGLNSRLK